MRFRSTLLAVALAVLPLAMLAQRPAPLIDEHDYPGTFSILGVDPVTGDIGGAVQSCVFSVNGVLWAEEGVGAVATQAIVDVSYGPQGLELLRKGMAPKDIIKTIWERDPDPRPATGPAQNQRNWTKHGRQFAVINAKGEMAAFTGPRADPWAGDKQGKFCTAQGNILAGQAVVDNMVSAFESSEKREDGQRNHLAFVPAVNAKILVGCDHAMVRIKLAHPDETKIGQIGLPRPFLDAAHHPPRHRSSLRQGFAVSFFSLRSP